MNTQLQTRPSHQEQHHQHDQIVQFDQRSQFDQALPVRRVKLLDRLALRVGLALITWGRRPLDLESRERRANRVEQAIAREGRLRAHERNARLLLPVR